MVPIFQVCKLKSVKLHVIFLSKDVKKLYFPFLTSLLDHVPSVVLGSIQIELSMRIKDNK